MSAVPLYLVTVQTPRGVAELEVPTYQGPEAAGRRGVWAAITARWGDVDDVTLVSVERLPAD